MKKTLPVLFAICATALVAPSDAFAAKTRAAKPTGITKYDTNNSGKLEADELEAVRKDFAAAPSGALAKLDADKDGKLADEEIAKLGAASARKGKRSAAVGLTKYDTNKNGKLETDEFDAVRKDFAAAPRGALAKLDADKDGKLTDEEIAKLAAARAKKGNRSDAARVEKRAKRGARKPV